MRFVFAGGGHLAELTARKLNHDDNEIVIIDDNRERIDQLAERLDVSLLEGDVTQPDILNEADPQRTDILFCLTDCDQTNILCALAGRTVGYGRVILSIADPRLEIICQELQFDEYITPARTVAQKLVDLAESDDAAARSRSAE